MFYMYPTCLFHHRRHRRHRSWRNNFLQRLADLIAQKQHKTYPKVMRCLPSEGYVQPNQRRTLITRGMQDIGGRAWVKCMRVPQDMHGAVAFTWLHSEVFIEHIPCAVMSVYRPGCMQCSYNGRDISADAHRTGRLSRILCSCMAISKVWEWPLTVYTGEVEPNVTNNRK